MSKIFEFKNEIDLESQIIWQYANADKMNSLLLQKQDWYKSTHEGFWQNWANDVLNIATANDFGLSIWGNLLQVARTYNVNGEMITLDTEQYRFLLRGRLLYLRMNSSVPSINEYLKLIFQEDGKAHIRDNLDMSVNYILEFVPTEEQLVVLLNTGLLPRPAGVNYKIYVIPPSEVFGFNNSGLCGFNQAAFWDELDWKNK